MIAKIGNPHLAPIFVLFDIIGRRQGEFELFGKSPQRFFAKVTPLEIEFDADARALMLFQGGNTLRFVRE